MKIEPMDRTETWITRRHKLNDYYLCLRNMALFEFEPSALDPNQHFSWKGLEQERWYWEAELTEAEQTKVRSAYHQWWQQFMSDKSP